jgi:hypothetical protein
VGWLTRTISLQPVFSMFNDFRKYVTDNHKLKRELQRILRINKDQIEQIEIRDTRIRDLERHVVELEAELLKIENLRVQLEQYDRVLQDIAAPYTHFSQWI